MRTVTFILSGGLAFGIGSMAYAEPEQAAGPEQAQARAREPAPAETETPACLAEPVVFRRFGVAEPQVISVTDCEQRPNPTALPLISALAAPSPSPVPKQDTEGSAEPPAATAEPLLLNPQLLVRLQQIASRFPDRAIEIVSGYRTRARATSRHRSGDALDVRVEGIDNEELSIFARTLEETGVGYYPNSTFVHIDVRAASAYWVDRSAPGERPDYVREQPGAVSAPDPVLATTPVEVEQDRVSAQLERALLDVHGPELPAYDAEAPSEDAPVPVVEAQPADATVAETAAAVTAEPAAAAAATAAAPIVAEPAPEGADAPDAAQLEAEIQTLLERALVVMQQANPAG